MIYPQMVDSLEWFKYWMYHIFFRGWTTGSTHVVIARKTPGPVVDQLQSGMFHGVTHFGEVFYRLRGSSYQLDDPPSSSSSSMNLLRWIKVGGMGQ